MKERPILLCGTMVRASLDDIKTHTRRLVKPQPVTDGAAWAIYWRGADLDGRYGPSVWGVDELPGDDVLNHCPYGRTGDRLWVKETFRPLMSRARGFDKQRYCYRADHPSPSSFDGTWKPSIFLPRVASRITFEIAVVRVERLQEISEEDARREGVQVNIFDPKTPQTGRFRHAYAELWDSINGKGSWSANPLVWVIEFRRIEEETR